MCYMEKSEITEVVIPLVRWIIGVVKDRAMTRLEEEELCDILKVDGPVRLKAKKGVA